MFGMSMAEMAVVAVIALVILGPEKLPEVARMAGKGMRELRKASNLFRDMLLLEESQQDTKKRAATRRAADEARRAEATDEDGAGEASLNERSTPPEDLDFMGPLDGPEDEFHAPRPPLTREAEMNPTTRAPDVREVRLKDRAILTASWHEVHLHTLSGELWR